METRNLSDTEFKMMVIRIFMELENRTKELNENFNKEQKTFKKEIDRKKKKKKPSGVCHLKKTIWSDNIIKTRFPNVATKNKKK